MRVDWGRGVEEALGLSLQVNQEVLGSPSKSATWSGSRFNWVMLGAVQVPNWKETRDTQRPQKGHHRDPHDRGQWRW